MSVFSGEPPAYNSPSAELKAAESQNQRKGRSATRSFRSAPRVRRLPSPITMTFPPPSLLVLAQRAVSLLKSRGVRLLWPRARAPLAHARPSLQGNDRPSRNSDGRSHLLHYLKLTRHEQSFQRQRRRLFLAGSRGLARVD